MNITKCILFLEHMTYVRCYYYPLQLVWLNVTAAKWDKFRANSSFYMKRNSNYLLERKYLRCVHTLPKLSEGSIIKSLDLLWLLYTNLCFLWVYFTLVLQLLNCSYHWFSVSIILLQIPIQSDKKNEENSWIQLTSPVWNTDRGALSQKKRAFWSQVG